MVQSTVSKAPQTGAHYRTFKIGNGRCDRRQKSHDAGDPEESEKSSDPEFNFRRGFYLIREECLKQIRKSRLERQKSPAIGKSPGDPAEEGKKKSDEKRRSRLSDLELGSSPD